MDSSKEVHTALDHAQMAAAGTDLKTVDMHLHHVVNCLVGPKGKGFDAGVGDPCKDMGDGALMDSAKDKQQHAELEQALHLADRGLADKDLKGAQKYANDVIARIKAAQKTG
jgi:hypothetical protein